MKADKIRISFPDDKPEYSVEADLELRYAPQTCAAACDFLEKQGGSFTGRLFHTIFNGFMLGLPEFDLPDDLPQENGTVTPAEGEIVYIYLPAGAERRMMNRIMFLRCSMGLIAGSLPPWVGGEEEFSGE